MKRTVKRKSDGVFGHLYLNEITWRTGDVTDPSSQEYDYVEIEKPTGYDSPYEEYYGEHGIFWPIPGTKVTYKKTHVFWFNNIVENAKLNLKEGEQYTISYIAPASSWCKIFVEEFPNMSLALSFFEYDRNDPIINTLKYKIVES